MFCYHDIDSLGQMYRLRCYSLKHYDYALVKYKIIKTVNTITLKCCFVKMN